MDEQNAFKFSMQIRLFRRVDENVRNKFLAHFAIEIPIDMIFIREK